MKVFKGVSVVVTLLLLVGSANASVTFYLSEAGLGESPTIGNPDPLPMSGTINVWCTTTEIIGYLGGVSLQLVADPAVVTFTAVSVPNYDIWMDLIPMDSGDDRWQSSGGTGGAVAGMEAVCVTSGTGMDPANDGTVPAFLYRDTGYDVAAGSFLFASIDYTATGASDLYLKVGPQLITANDGSTYNPDINFGSGDDPVNGGDAGAESTLPDGHIPEPATLALLGFGAVGLLLRRKR